MKVNVTQTVAADLAAFLAGCRRAALAGEVRLLPGRGGLAVDCDDQPNPACRSVLDGHAPTLPVIESLHLRARCEFRLPTRELPDGARIVQDGADLEALAPGKPRGHGELIGAVLTDDEDLIRSLLLPDGLKRFAAEHLHTDRGLADLQPRFGAGDLEFEIRRSGAATEIVCRFTAEMDAYRRPVRGRGV